MKKEVKVWFKENIIIIAGKPTAKISTIALGKYGGGRFKTCNEWIEYLIINEKNETEWKEAINNYLADTILLGET